MYRRFVAESQLSPIDAKHGEIQEINPIRQWTRQQVTANSDENLTSQTVELMIYSSQQRLLAELLS